MSFPRYAVYKDSGVEWLGEVPEHWDITKVKHVFKIGRGRVIAQDILQENGLYPVFSSQTKDNGCLGYIDTYDFDCDQITWTTDGANAGTVFIRGGKHNCTNVCGTLELKTLTNNLFYYGYYLQFATQFYKRPDTNGAKIMNNEMADILLFKISISEQTTIAAFLDCETAKIDNLINEQKKLVELLKEKRQAVISTSVTKGLNPHAPMKDSGVEWLGEVPQGWKVKQFRHIAKIVRGASPRPAGDPIYFADNNDDEINTPWVTVAEITKDNQAYLDEVKEFLTPLGVKNSQFFPKGLLIFTNSGATLGVPKILNINCCANDGVLVFKDLSSNVNILFAYNFLLTTTERLRTEMKQGGGQPNLNTDIVKNISFALPPLPEQTNIVAFLDQETAKIDNLIQQAQKATTLLQERRTALISAAVTGKIDVREYKSLPASL